VLWLFVTIAHDSVPITSRPVAVLSKSLRHTARFFSSIASSPSTSGLPGVDCRLSGLSRKPLILNPFQASRLSSFFPTLAHPSSKSFPCVSYEKTGGWGSGPTNCSRAGWSCDTPRAHLRRWPLHRISSTSHKAPIASHCALVAGRLPLATSAANLSVAPSLPPAGHWYLRSGATQVREEEAKT